MIRVDGHAVIASDYVSQCVKILENGEADGAGGPIETIGENFMSEAISLGMSSFFGVGNSAFRTSSRKQFADTVPFPAYPKKWIERTGLYDEELQRNQDDDYNYRLRKLGARILMDPAIRSKYYSRSNVISLIKQYFQYGFWKVRILQKIPSGMSWRQFAPPVFSAAFLILPFVPQLRLVWFLFLFAYLVFVIAGTVVTCFRNFKFACVLPVIFFALHFSYGAGFLSGLIYFMPRWFDKKS